MTEQQIHRQICDFLSIALAGNAFFSTMPLGGGGKLRGAILNGLGVKKGLPDILLISDGRAFFLEVKSKHGVPTAAQYECHRALQRAGSPVAIVRSIDDAMNAIQNWGLSVRGTWSIPGSVTVGGSAA